jgi:hypothetical protein
LKDFKPNDFFKKQKKIAFHTSKLLKYANIKMTMVPLDGMPERGLD